MTAKTVFAYSTEELKKRQSTGFRTLPDHWARVEETAKEREDFAHIAFELQDQVKLLREAMDNLSSVRTWKQNYAIIQKALLDTNEKK